MEKKIQINLTLDLHPEDLATVHKNPSLLRVTSDNSSAANDDTERLMDVPSMYKNRQIRFTPLDTSALTFHEPVLPKPVKSTSVLIPRDPTKGYARRADQFSIVLAGCALTILTMMALMFHMKPKLSAKSQAPTVAESNEAPLISLSGINRDGNASQDFSAVDQASALEKKIESLKIKKTSPEVAALPSSESKTAEPVESNVSPPSLTIATQIRY